MKFERSLITIILVCLVPSVAVAEVLREPTRIISENGTLESKLYVVFGKAEISGAVDSSGNPIETIWTRVYSLTAPDPTDPTDEIPGPTFVFHPDDWLSIELNNYLNRSDNPWLNSFQTNIPDAPPGSDDDIDEQVPHEINIPHNADNTNLHVHGLHVDPKKDNVTLLILPEDDDPSNYVPELQRLIPDIDRWWSWEYGYKIPADHLPGTHWYHAHKHGATSTHVENGMAGTLVIRPREDADSIIPGLWDTGHDRVLVLQEIANYGLGQGRGRGHSKKGQVTALNTPDLTVNGQHQPELQLPAGQLERWRFIVAGANHRTASYLWVGRVVMPVELNRTLKREVAKITTKAASDSYADRKRFFSAGDSATYGTFPGRVRMIAADGVTFSQAVPITMDTPTFAAAGNRNDLLIQPHRNAQGIHYVFKGYPTAAPPIQSFAEAYPELFGAAQGDAALWRYAALTKGKVGSANGSAVFTVSKGTGFPSKANLLTDPYALNTNYSGFEVEWANNAGQGQAASYAKVAVGPLLAGERDPVTNGVAARVRSETLKEGAVGWQPMGDAGGGGSVTEDYLIILDISGIPKGPRMPRDARLNARLNRRSPNGDAQRSLLKKVVDERGELASGIPSYVSQFPRKFDGRQVIVFDRSAISFDYTPEGGTTLQFRQFWLNGRQFNLMDFLGNPKAEKLIQMPIENVDPELGRYNPNGAFPSNSVWWTNAVGDDMVFTNPGYYVPVKNEGTSSSPQYTYDYAHPHPLTYESVTGLDGPNQPVSTTAEEWLLINNSDIFHPFHIHISPFFVTEIGQLDYSDGSWDVKKLSDTDSPFKWVENSWWDVILIPPHGYVKMQTWINIPDQKPVDTSDPNSAFKVVENANVYGSWVYHCHILRHEDRGMMMLVNTRPK